MRLTRSGAGVVTGSVALVVAGLLLEYRSLVVVGTVGAIAIAVALVWVARHPSIAIERSLDPARVTAGEPAYASITATNPGPRATAGLVAGEHVGDDTVTVTLPVIEPGGSSSTPYRLPTEKRGVFDIGPLELAKIDPLGLAHNVQRLSTVDRLWVHPRTHHVQTMPSGRSRDLDGPTSDQAPEGGMAFHTLREYVRGDDLRQIHWRSTARTGSLMVRHMVDASLPVTTIVLDTNRARYEPARFEHAVEAAASIALSCGRERFPVHLRTTDADASDVAAGGVAVLDDLAAVTLTADADLASVAPRLGRSGGGGTLVLLLGEPAEEDDRCVALLKHRYERTVVVRFHDGVRLGARRTPSAGPGSVVIDASGIDDFVQGWARAVLRR